MRARLAAVLRRMAQRLDPDLADGRVHHVVATSTTATTPLTLYVDGKQIRDELLRFKRGNGGAPLGLS